MTDPEGLACVQRIAETTDKSCSQFSAPGERILRKTVKFIEKPLVVKVPEPKINGSRCYRKACHFMWFLWNHGYKKQIPRETMLAYVQNFLGAFRTTVNFWLGHKVYAGIKGQLYVKAEQESYLQKLRFVYATPTGYELQHENVPLPYHYKESLNALQESSEKPQDEFQHDEGLEATVSMSLVSHSHVERSGEATEASASLERHNKQQHVECERIDSLKYTCTSEQPLEMAPEPWLTEEEMAEIQKRDRKRLETVNKEYLSFLEKSVKTQQ